MGKSVSNEYKAASKRHHATAKAWEWFESDERALGYSLTLRLAIERKLRELDAELLAWDRTAIRG